MLIRAAYMSHEKGKVIDRTDPQTHAELETYVPLIQQGNGKQVLSTRVIPGHGFSPDTFYSANSANGPLPA